MLKEEIELRAQHILTILGSIVNNIGEPLSPFNVLKNLHFENQ